MSSGMSQFQLQFDFLALGKNLWLKNVWNSPIYHNIADVWPPKVPVALFCREEERICNKAGLTYSAPYSPRMNPAKDWITGG